MPNTELIPVTKHGEYLEVHPVAYAQHEALGWVKCARQEQAAPVPVIDRPTLEAALAMLPGEYTDADYVIRGMRMHFGELFTADDEAKVRELVKAPDDGKVTAAEIKAALTTAGVTFKGNASKGDLQALLTAFERSGLTGAEWNNLAEEDRANRVSY